MSTPSTHTGVSVTRSSFEACRRLLREGKMPEDMHDRVATNADFAAERLRRVPSAEAAAAFVELLRTARIKEEAGCPSDEVIAAYMEATAACPTRAEALHGAARFCRDKRLFGQGRQFAKQGVAIVRPKDGPSIEDWIYDYGLLDELALNAYWCERYVEFVEACDQLLIVENLPTDDRDRIVTNRQFAVDKLAPPGSIASPPARRQVSTWTPAGPAGGTEIMVEALRQRLGPELGRINLQINGFSPDEAESRPLVVWFHHDYNQAAVQWLRNKEQFEGVARFVFVSNWQRDRFIDHFGLPAEKCTVLRNATDVNGSNRRWAPGKPLKMAYTSTPFRGLSVLLDAWDLLRPADAELHIWSSIKLYGAGFDDEPYRRLYDRASSLPGVEYHGIVPNADLRKALRDIDFLTYPSTFEETSCLSVIEALAAGCRVICPSFGALPETSRDFARLYKFQSDPKGHAQLFARVLSEEISNPWGGRHSLSETQQNWTRSTYDWSVRVAEWKSLIDLVSGWRRPQWS